MTYSLIIQAGGKGTRLMGENSVFPKLLKTFSGKTIYDHMLDSLNPTGEIVVILDQSYSCWEAFLLEKASKVIYSDKKGDLAGIEQALDFLWSKSCSQKVLVAWSDLYFTQSFLEDCRLSEESAVTSNVLLLLSDGVQKCRLSFQDGFSSNEQGVRYPFPGVFILDLENKKTKAFKNWIDETPNPSFDLLAKEHLEEVFFEGGVLSKNITQIGTKEEFTQHNCPFSPRSFNKIHFFDSFVIKESQNKTDLEHEYEWLKESYPQHQFSFSRRTFDLEMPLFRHSSKFLKENLVNGAIESLSDLHESRTAKYIGLEEGRNLFEEVLLQKALKRVEIFRKHLPVQISKIDGVEIIQDLETRLRNLFDLILRDLGTGLEYLNFVHGDPTLSNLCLDQDGKEFIWIDPRPPFFKEHLFYGFKILDFAKLYYSLSGYDSLNRYEIIPRIIDGNILINELDVLTEVPSVFPFPNSFLEKFMPFLWLSLAAYAIDTPIEASIAYGIGIKKLLKFSIGDYAA